MTQIEKAIQAARINTGKVLLQITGSNCTSCICRNKDPSPDLAALDKATDECWTRYATTMQNIGNASGMNVVGLVNPVGRPYYIDENEGEQTGTYGPCGLGRDSIATFKPGTTYNWTASEPRSLPYMTPGC
jgi:hypothetical protein